MRRRIIREIRPSHVRPHSEEAVRLTKHLLLASHDARASVTGPGLPGSTFTPWTVIDYDYRDEL